MNVAILYSGGKDSTFAIDYALEKGWKIDYLLSVKPSRTDCFLFHFATVEHTPKIAEILGLKHILVGCDVADPEKEAEIVKNVVEKQQKVDAVVLGGTGLQQTQLKSIQKALMPLGIEVFAAHAGQDHDEVMKQMLRKGYKFMITQIASEGLNKEWIGRILDEKNMAELFKRSVKYGFHCGGEGGYYDTLTLDGPIFSKALEVISSKKIMESECIGYLLAEGVSVVEKKKIENLNVLNR